MAIDPEKIERALKAIRSHAKLAGYRIEAMSGGYIATRLEWRRGTSSTTDAEQYHFATLKSLYWFILEKQARWMCSHTGAELPEWIRRKDAEEEAAEAPREIFPESGEHSGD
jgi:hypothetical protein